MLPTAQNREDVLPFYDEVRKRGGSCIGIAKYKDYDEWLVGKQNRHTGKNASRRGAHTGRFG